MWVMSIRCPAITGDGTNARDITKTAAKADKIIFSLYIMILQNHSPLKKIFRGLEFFEQLFQGW
jgi:hypothetical protein